MTWYEELRAAATGREARYSRDRFVLQRDGMVAWLRSMPPTPTLSEPSSPPPPGGNSLLVPPVVHDEVVPLLADLVLRGLPEGPDHDS